MRLIYRSNIAAIGVTPNGKQFSDGALTVTNGQWSLIRISYGIEDWDCTFEIVRKDKRYGGHRIQTTCRGDFQENNTVIPGPELARAGLGANKDGFGRINRERLLPRVPGADIDGHVVGPGGAVAAFECCL